MSPYLPPLPEMPVTHVPFWMWLRSSRRMLEHVATDPHRSDEGGAGEFFTAACAAAYLGAFDTGYLIMGSSREQRLALFSQWLPEDQFETVVAVAVPQRYRELPASELEAMIRHGSAEDRGWAGCWLALCGWFEGDDCTFFGTDPDERLERVNDHIREVITSEEETSYWSGLISSALWMYRMNGPPPLGLSRATLGGIRAGWIEVVQLVPARLLADDDSFPQGEQYDRPD
jgi:hypothetical protein